MRPINEGTALAGFYGTTLTPGTVTGTGIDWAPYYEPSAKLVANMGALTAGTAVVHFAGGTAAADVAVSYGTIQAAGAAAGTTVYELDVANITTRYVSAYATVTGGTVTIGSAIIGKPRTVT